MPSIFFVYANKYGIMIYACPHCGHELSQQLNDGLAHCTHCGRIFDSSTFNRLLAAAWLVRRNHLSVEQLQAQIRLTPDEALFVSTFVSDHCYSHEDFQQFLKKLGVSNKSYIE